MRLNPQPFSMIESGEKTIELRLYDEKRQKICVGDRIRFIHTEGAEKQLVCAVKNMHVFPSFEALYAYLPLRKCGYTEETLPFADPKDMEAYYSKSEQEKYGVVGIEIEVTK